MKSSVLILFIILGFTYCGSDYSKYNHPSGNLANGDTSSHRYYTYIKWGGITTKYHFVNDSFQLEDFTQKSKINFYYEEYYPSGILKEKGVQGWYNGMGTSLGTTYQYNLSGILTTTIRYHSASFDSAKITITEYYPEGRPKSIKEYKNFVQYEIDSIPIGLWQFYNTQGRLTQTELYNDGKKVQTKYY